MSKRHRSLVSLSFVLVFSGFVARRACTAEAEGDEAPKKRQGMYQRTPDSLLPQEPQREGGSMVQVGDKDVTRVRLEGSERFDKLMVILIPGKGYGLRAALKRNEGEDRLSMDPLIWLDGAIHEIAKPLTLGRFRFRPEKDGLLTFKVDTSKGYIFMDGKGDVQVLESPADKDPVEGAEDAETISLDPKDKGRAFGDQVKTKPPKEN